MEKNLKYKSIAESYLSGSSTTEVARQFSLSQSGVARILHRMGVDVRTPKPRHPDSEFVRLYHDGLGAQQIATRLQCSISLVLRKLNRNGIKGKTKIALENERKWSRYKYGPHQKFNVADSEFVELRSYGMSIRQIANTLGCSSTLVLKVLRRNK